MPRDIKVQRSNSSPSQYAAAATMALSQQGNINNSVTKSPNAELQQQQQQLPKQQQKPFKPCQELQQQQSHQQQKHQMNSISKTTQQLITKTSTSSSSTSSISNKSQKQSVSTGYNQNVAQSNKIQTPPPLNKSSLSNAHFSGVKNTVPNQYSQLSPYQPKSPISHEQPNFIPKPSASANTTPIPVLPSNNIQTQSLNKTPARFSLDLSNYQNYNTAARGWGQCKDFYRPITFQQDAIIAYTDF